jgi:outer membrane protein OmpA-like peptidoglycan-associated protein
MKPTVILGFLVALASSLPVMAQTPTTLSGAQITESALVEALTPAPPPLLTRSIDSAGVAPAQKPAKASLLITFETNATALTAEAKRELDIVGQALNTNRLIGFNFTIEGHADPRGSAARNQQLSQARAEAVRQYLVDNQHVQADRLTAVGKGDREPLDTRNPSAPENRRVTFVNMSQESGTK